MKAPSPQQVTELLNAIRPWIDQEQAFLVDLAKEDPNARLVIASALLDSEQVKEAVTLLESVALAPEGNDAEGDKARIRALIELTHLLMLDLKYDQAEDLLWQARNCYVNGIDEDISREDISLLIAQCRFGQGFVQEAVDRAEEVLRKQISQGVVHTELAKTHQQLGWFYLHKMDAIAALHHVKQAMELAPGLNQELVDEALKAEQDGNFEKAVEYYFDSIEFDS